MYTLLEPLLTPDQLQLTDADRRAAVAKLDSAVRQAVLTRHRQTTGNCGCSPLRRAANCAGSWTVSPTRPRPAG
jgi:hypothetical protein